jgi:hypothetical protein
MKYKDGVITQMMVVSESKKKLLEPSPEIESAILAANALSKAIAGKEIVVTALLDGKHMKGSKHYSGNAFDMRTQQGMYSSEQINTLYENLKDNLGKDYDVVLHPTHIHVEYDPK